VEIRGLDMGKIGRTYPRYAVFTASSSSFALFNRPVTAREERNAQITGAALGLLGVLAFFGWLMAL
jgi:hypothetical protein